jgi:hypothetical protein
VLGPEALVPVPFLDLLTEYGAPWGMEDRGATGSPEGRPSRGSMLLRTHEGRDLHR